MFYIREALESDGSSLLELAKELGSAGNLPHTSAGMKSLIEKSLHSFRSAQHPDENHLYLFVLVDQSQERVIGSSLIFSKHGTEEAPHTFLRVIHKTRFDRSTKTERKHQLLRFEFEEDGPTEIGGLILKPEYRAKPEALGKLLSYSRFIYMGMQPKRFEKEVIAELLPPFNEDGTSELWEAFGKRFTGMSYQEADALSRKNKDFIKNLFPTEDIYTCLFSEKAQSVIGQTGESTKAAQILLERIGFSYLNAVDPFDGGPHLEAKRDEISLIKRLKRLKASPAPLTSSGTRGVLGFFSNSQFRSCLCFYKESERGFVDLDESSLSWLRTQKPDNDQLFVVTLL